MLHLLRVTDFYFRRFVIIIVSFQICIYTVCIAVQNAFRFEQDIECWFMLCFVRISYFAQTDG